MRFNTIVDHLVVAYFFGPPCIWRYYNDGTRTSHFNLPVVTLSFSDRVRFSFM